MLGVCSFTPLKIKLKHCIRSVTARTWNRSQRDLLNFTISKPLLQIREKLKHLKKTNLHLKEPCKFKVYRVPELIGAQTQSPNFKVCLVYL